MPDKKVSPTEIAANLAVTGNIKSWLQFRRLTQEHLANRMHVSKATVSKWLRGLQSMNGQQLSVIAEIIGVKPQELILPPGHRPASAEYEQAAAILEGLAAEDVRRWLEFGETLRETKPRS